MFSIIERKMEVELRFSHLYAKATFHAYPLAKSHFVRKRQLFGDIALAKKKKSLTLMTRF